MASSSLTFCGRSSTTRIVAGSAKPASFPLAPSIARCRAGENTPIVGLRAVRSDNREAVDEVAALEERVRLLTEQLAEANAQQDATDEVLRVIGSSAFELGPVFDTVVENAVALCHADAAQIWSGDAA